MFLSLVNLEKFDESCSEFLILEVVSFSEILCDFVVVDVGSAHEVEIQVIDSIGDRL